MWGSGVMAPPTLNLVSRWKGVGSFTYRPPRLWGKRPDIYYTGSWMGCKTVLGVLEERNNDCFYRESKKDRLARG